MKKKKKKKYKVQSRKSRTKPHATRSRTVGAEPVGPPALPEPLAGRRTAPFGGWGCFFVFFSFFCFWSLKPYLGQISGFFFLGFSVGPLAWGSRSPTQPATVGPEPLGVPALPDPLVGRRGTPFGVWVCFFLFFVFFLFWVP